VGIHHGELATERVPDGLEFFLHDLIDRGVRVPEQDRDDLAVLQRGFDGLLRRRR
jgi:hypothetical protein